MVLGMVLNHFVEEELNILESDEAITIVGHEPLVHRFDAMGEVGGFIIGGRHAQTFKRQRDLNDNNHCEE